MSHTAKSRARRVRRSSFVQLATAALGVLTIADAARAANVYWDINGATLGAGGATPSGAWDNSATNWNTDSLGGAGTFANDIVAANVGVFAAGTDATGAYTVTIPDPSNPNYFPTTAGGFTVTQGTVTIAGLGNGGLGGGTAPSTVNVGASGTFPIDVAAGAIFNFGASAQLPSFIGGATINKTGPGYFNNIGQNQVPAGQFTGKFRVSGGTMGVFFGQSNVMLGVPAAFVSDQLTLENNAILQTLQTNNSVSFNARQGINIGSGGATIHFAGQAASASIGSIQFTSRITGGAEGARVPITIESNTKNAPGTTIATNMGATGFNFLDNSSSATAPPLYANWIINNGEIGPVVAGTDNGLGAAPTVYQSDSITLNGGNLRPNANMTTPATRGITLGANGGGFHPVGALSIWQVNSPIVGAGQLRVFVEANASYRVILAASNTYTGGTLVTGINGTTGIGTLQGDTVSLQGAIQNDAKLRFDQTFNGTYAGNMSGSGILNKTNTGTVYLTGTNTFTGQTFSLAGALIANSPASMAGYNSFTRVNANTGGIVGVSAGAGGQWTTPDIDLFLANVTLDATSSAGFNVEGANSFAYANGVSLGTGGVSKLGTGKFTLNHVRAALANVNAGTLAVANGLGDGSTSRLTALPSVSAGATFDINQSKLVVQFGTAASPLAATRASIIAGRGGTDFGNATWAGTGGIASAAAAPGGIGDGSNAGDGVSFAVGYVENSALPSLGLPSYTEFGGQTVDSGSMLIRFTRGADCNLDGKVNTDDVTVVGALYGQSNSEWSYGDFDYDGVVDSDDVTVLGALYDATAPALSSAQLTSQFGSDFAAAFARGRALGASVPEPAGITAILGGLAFGMFRRRLRTRKPE